MSLLKRFLPPILAVLLMVTALFPFQEKKERLRIAPGIWPTSEPLLLAGDLQILPQDKFQIIEMPWSSAVVRAFGSGAADVAVVTLESVLRMRDAGQKLKVLMALSRSAGADAILARQGIQRIEDLKHKRVGVERSAGTYLLIHALESAGMTMADIETTTMFQSEMEQALMAGQVDAVVATEPWLTSLCRNQVHHLYDSSQLKVPVIYLLVASERACTAYHEELVSLLKIQADMARKIWAGPPFPGEDALLRRERLEAGELAACLARLHIIPLSENVGALRELPQMARQMEAELLRSGLIARPMSSDWISTTFAEEALR